MATIKSIRAAALAYNGMTGKFVRDVMAPDPAWERGGDEQCVVDIDGKELYFLTSEVTLDDADKAVQSKQVKPKAAAPVKAPVAKPLPAAVQVNPVAPTPPQQPTPHVFTPPPSDKP